MRLEVALYASLWTLAITIVWRARDDFARYLLPVLFLLLVALIVVDYMSPSD